jgi:hypothetical protein
LAQVQQAHPEKRILTFYQDEARFGQHGTITRVWAKVGTRPRAIHQTQYDYLYVFAAVCPQTGQAVGLLTPEINTHTMNAFLAEFAQELPPDVHAVMVLDRAGWHTAEGCIIRTSPRHALTFDKPPKPQRQRWHDQQIQHGRGHQPAENHHGHRALDFPSGLACAQGKREEP